MKKVININFQGRVVPIEETAYELLKQYVESLRKYFANEEGKDEIINDIEGRIAELFSERLKKGTPCITDSDVNAVIASIGRPEDFDAQEAEAGGTGANTSSSSGSSYQQQSNSNQKSQQSYTYTSSSRGSLYRNEDDKILGGVCSGLANYLNIDPVLARIVFVVFIAPLFWIYILLWIIVPSKSVQSNITKRLYRSTENKVLAGVAGGLATYFKIDVWIPRLIFALPLIIGTVSIPFGMFWNDWDFWWGPRIFTGGLTGTLTILYVILWIAVPVANTATEKLEMRGEKVDINSIRDTVKEDMETLKSRAQSWGQEVKQSAQQLGERAKEFGSAAGNSARSFSNETAPLARQAGSGLGNVIRVFIKVIALIIGGSIVLSLLVAMGALFGAGVVVMPFRDFVLEGNAQTMLAWGSLLLFFGVPLLAFLVWIIRKIAGSKRNPYVGMGFGILWVIGLVCFISLIAGINRNFYGDARIENEIKVAPISDKMIIDVADSKVLHYGGWFNFGDGIRMTDDSLFLSNVQLRVMKSVDTGYHISYTRFSSGSSDGQAEELARNTSYGISQLGNTIYLDRGFSIKRGEKFRNQHVQVNIEIPVGKRIIVDRKVSRRLNKWFMIGNRNRYWRDWEWNDDEESSWLHGDWNKDVEYIMTPAGIKRVEDLDADELMKGNYKDRDYDAERRRNERNDADDNRDEENSNDSRKPYRYQQDSGTKKIIDTVKVTTPSTTTYNETTEDGEEETSYSHENSSSVFKMSAYVFGRLIQQ